MLEEYIVVIKSQFMGQGNDEIGEKLMQGFLYSLTEQETLPKTVIFYNTGVLLTSDSSKSFEDIKSLKDNGVKIMVCGACVDFFNLKEQISIPEITNMFNIVEMLSKSKKIIYP